MQYFTDFLSKAEGLAAVAEDPVAVQANGVAAVFG